MAYNVFESTNMLTTKGAARILDAVCTEDIENGTFGYLTGTGDVKTFVKGTKAGEVIVVADNPEWDEDMVNGLYRSSVRRDKYVNKKGVPFRVRVVAKGDTFATAIEGVTSDSRTNMKKDAFVTIDSTSGKLVASATKSTTSVAFEAVVGKERIHGGTLITPTRNYGVTSKMYECTVKTLV